MLLPSRRCACKIRLFCHGRIHRVPKHVQEVDMFIRIVSKQNKCLAPACPFDDSVKILTSEVRFKDLCVALRQEYRI
eukprot:1356408-Amorphochlora_amoeboformis.AAC.1